MLSAIGLIIAIALLIVMIVKGVDMITASVVTAAIILVTSGLDFWEGLLKTFSEGAGSFCSSWFLILALGGIFGELVNQTGLATKVAKSLSAALGAKRVGLIIMICTFFITLLGINGYIMVFVLYPIADSLAAGFNLVPLLIGTFAVSQIIDTAAKGPTSIQRAPAARVKGFGLSFREFVSISYSQSCR